MGVTVTGRDYTNRYSPIIVDWLLGNVGDWQKLVISVSFAVEKKFSQVSPLLIENSGLDLVLGGGSTWEALGFDVGDSITWSIRFAELDNDGFPQPQYPIFLTEVRQVVLIQGDRMTINAPWIQGIPSIPLNNGNYRIDQVEIYVDKKPEGVEVVYSHLTNTDSQGANLISFIDGTKTRIRAEGLDSLLGWQDMELIGLQSGMSLRSSRWIFDNKEGAYTYNYRIELEFMISAFFEDLDNFVNLEAPPQLLGLESLTDNFEIIGYPQLNNPNTQIKSDKQYTRRLGNVGWFNENINGLESGYSVLGLTYTDVISGEPLQGLSFAGETRVRAIIAGVPNLANGLSKIGIGFIFLPEDEAIYKELPTPFQENLMVNTGGGVSSGVFVPTPSPYTGTYTGFENVVGARMDIKNIHFTIDGDNLIYEAIFSPNQSFINYIGGLDDIDRNYSIWVSVGDRLSPANYYNRVSLSLDYNQFRAYIPTVGEYSPMNILFAEHPQNETEGRSVSCVDFRVEDDVLGVIPFKVDITKDIPNKIEFVLEVERELDGLKYELQRYAVDLSGYPNDALGVPQWDYNQERGFKLETGQNKNFAKVIRNGAEDDGNNKAYLAYYGFKIRWEDWISRQGVPSDFFNGSLENNGFNNDWVSYFEVFGWVFKFTINTYSTLNGEPVKYVNSEELAFSDYNTNLNISTFWETQRESNGAILPSSIDATTGEPLGVILDNEEVRLRVLYVKQNGVFQGLEGYWGTICIEIDKGAGEKEFRQLSTEWGRELDNPLIPIAGETRVKKTSPAANQILLECLVNPSLLDGAQRYKLSSRLGCKYECSQAQAVQKTKILIYFDSSGSMDSSLYPLGIVRDFLLKPRLLAFYGGDEVLYNESVIVTNFVEERTFKMLNFEGSPPPPEDNVVVLVFQNEAGGTYYPPTNPRSLNYDNDLAALRNRLGSFGTGYYKGAIFQVGADNDFKSFIQGVELGVVPYDGANGLSDKNEFNYYYDILAGGTPKYYLDLIIGSLVDFGFSV